MQLFYATEIEGNTMMLSEQESAHCSRVLRMNSGDEIELTDGKGHFYKGMIRVAHDKRTSVEIVETINVDPLPYQLHLYVGLTKHADRLEWMLEKCVELGLSSFTPLITMRTERKNIRTDRLEAIALSAMKQSLKAWLPKVNPPLKFSDLLDQHISGPKLMAHCISSLDRVSIADIPSSNTMHVLIGPEGDFTSEEVDMAIKKGYNGISLGGSRLRTENAGLTVCNWMYLNNINTQVKK